MIRVARKAKKNIPFYPLPYREKRGGILFPASGYGWYMRDDVLAAELGKLERFVPDHPRPRRKHHQMTEFLIEEARIFNGVGPTKSLLISSTISS